MVQYGAWLRLHIDTRHKLAAIFKIPKTGATEVVSTGSVGDVVRDGYSIHDIEAAITKDAIQTYLGSTVDNFVYLWEDLINKVEGREPVIHATMTAAVEDEPLDTADETAHLGPIPDAPFEPKPDEQPLVVTEKPKNKGGRPRKHEKKPH